MVVIPNLFIFPNMTRSKFFVGAFLLALTLSAGADVVLDRSIEFSVDAPKGAKINSGSSTKGNFVTVDFTDTVRREALQIQAYRVEKSGGFGEPIPSVFSKFVAGMSKQMGTAPAKPIRTLSYQGQTLYVVSHLGVNNTAGLRVGMTTVAFFAERGSWNKMITLIFISLDNVALTDEQLLKRFAVLKYKPVAT